MDWKACKIGKVRKIFLQTGICIFIFILFYEIPSNLIHVSILPLTVNK